MKSGMIKIAIADDHDIMRDGLIRQLSIDRELEVIIQAKNGRDLLEQIARAEIKPDIAVVDLRMPVMDGFMVADKMKNEYPMIRILVLSGYSSDYNIASMISKGVRGYLTKDCSPDEFRTAIHTIADEGYYYSGLVSENDFNTLLQNRNQKAYNIPEREMEFLKWYCTDLSFEQIAARMNISTTTLNGCRGRLFDRLGISNRIALVLFAVQSGIEPNFKDDSHILKSKS